MVSQAGDDTTWSGDAGSLGGAGVTWRGEGASSQGDDGIEGDEGDIDVSLVGKTSGGLIDGGGAAGGVADGGVANGSVT
jgi:hypothetical protein